MIFELIFTFISYVYPTETYICYENPYECELVSEPVKTEPDIIVIESGDEIDVD